MSCKCNVNVNNVNVNVNVNVNIIVNANEIVCMNGWMCTFVWCMGCMYDLYVCIVRIYDVNVCICMYGLYVLHIIYIYIYIYVCVCVCSVFMQQLLMRSVVGIVMLKFYRMPTKAQKE